MTYALPAMALSYDDHCRLFSILPPNSNKIIAAGPARIYHATFGAADSDWSFSGLRGILVFGCDARVPVHRTNAAPYGATYWFRLVDMRRGKVVWVHQVQDVIEYEAEKPFFHVFCGKSRKFGFRFEEDDDAVIFLQEVTQRIVDIPVQRSPSKKSGPKPQRVKSQRKTIDRSMISSPVPESFRHVAHMGVDEKGSVDASWNVAPEWTKLLQKLEGYGIDAEMVEENLEFVKGFLAGAEAVRSSVSSSDSESQSSLDSPKPARTKRHQPIHRKPVPEYALY
ncbi:hypothetical protein EVG20_g5322 [Dentipellis fragilis]|uniref:WH1 domain-containing protein n=1 Tax=Dentipellis fragilis TaxID=205917 RepID=A0A4Y9YVL8_9AGAM|nr:hypothetical protein EVG20_g5322 [Dentipellis fragilis]